MKVLAVTKHHKNENWRYVDLLDEANGKAIKAFSSQPRETDALILGSPLPAGATIEEGQYGPKLNFPRPAGSGGGRMQTSWRNTEEGFKYEQARMDRRTALMQAVQSLAGISTGSIDGAVTLVADGFYLWLRKE